MQRTELDLVNCGRGRPGGYHLLQFASAEVRHADRPGEPRLTSPLHTWPGPGGAPLRPVDQIQINLIQTEPPQALPGFGNGVFAPWKELCRDEHVLALHAAVPQRPSDALLVGVSLGGVDMAVSQLQRPAHGVHAGQPVRHLPYAQAKHGHLISIRQDAGTPVWAPGMSPAARRRGLCSITAVPANAGRVCDRCPGGLEAFEYEPHRHRASPIAVATRLTDLLRTSPTAKTPGRLVSRNRGIRSASSS